MSIAARHESVTSATRPHAAFDSDAVQRRALHGVGQRGRRPSRMRIAYCISLVAMVGSTAAPAGESSIQCKYDGTQQEMNACAVRDYKAADELLNIKYRQTLSVLSPETQQQLRQEQRTWLKQRDPQCKAQAKASEGGSIWPLEFYGCLQAITEQRTREFERWQVKK